MNSIKYKDCDFINKIKIKCDDKSEVYHDDRYLYKINKLVDKYSSSYCLFYSHRLSKLSHIKIQNCVLPNAKIKRGVKVVGSRAFYIEGKKLSDFFDNSDELYTFLNIIYNMSLKHKEIHSYPEMIIIGDNNFTNILYDDNNMPYLVDFEDCGIANVPVTACSMTYANYCKAHGCALSSYTQVSDIFSDFLEFIEYIFNKQLNEITEYEIDSLAEKSESIANLKFLIQYVQRNHGVYKIPYLHELISVKDFNNKELVLKR